LFSGHTIRPRPSVTGAVLAILAACDNHGRDLSQRPGGTSLATDVNAPKQKNRAWLMYLGALGLIVVLAVVATTLLPALGLAKPGTSGRAAVAAAAEVDQVLASPDADYGEFSTTLRVALVAHDNMVVSNSGEVELDHLLGSILDCYTAAREAWQAEIEDRWSPETFADPQFWLAAHPRLEVPASTPLTLTDVREACRIQAARTLKDAIRLASK
jgi:hypothetical protein